MFNMIDIVALTIIAFIIPKDTRWIGITGLTLMLFFEPVLYFVVALLAAAIISHS
jgi:hypothetical protein